MIKAKKGYHQNLREKAKDRMYNFINKNHLRTIYVYIISGNQAGQIDF